MRSAIPEPDYDDPKEVYAFFGLTYYACSVLEQGLINYIVAVNAKGNRNVTVHEVQDLFDSFDKKTFGQLLSSIRKVVELPKSSEEDLQKSLIYRNYLAHRFWENHDQNILTAEGRKKMIDELIEIMKFVKQVDTQFDELWLSAWEALGVSREWVSKQVELMLKERY